MAKDARINKGAQVAKDRFISVFLGLFAILWLLPIAWTLWTSLHPYQDVLERGIVSWPSEFTLRNYGTALHQMHVPRYFLNTVLIIVPTVIFALLLSSFAAFVMTRYRIRLQLPLLLFFTAGSMFPIQVIYFPIFKMYILIGDFVGSRTVLYNNLIGVIIIHIAMQIGFATFVLHSHLLKIPREFSEQAEVDGASVWKHYWLVILPMLRAPLATLAILISTFIYNDFLVGWSFLKNDSLFPITTSLTRVGAFNRVIPDQGVLAAGAFLVALPLLILFITFRKSFSTGVMLGTGK